MKVLECEAKQLLRAREIPVPEGRVVSTGEEAREIANTIGGPVVAKAQIPAGRRMKAGGIRFADTSAQAPLVADELLGAIVLGFDVQQVLVEERLHITSELFLAVTYDDAARTPVILASKAGGIDIGILRPNFLVSEPSDPFAPPNPNYQITTHLPPQTLVHTDLHE
jgi:succinyl-CoA synthetase beta subunit